VQPARRAGRNPTPAQEFWIATDVSRQDRLPARGIRVSQQTPQANPARTRKRARERKKSTPRRTATPARPETIAETDLKAQLALLADPETIARGPVRAAPSDVEAPPNRTPAAKRARAKTIAAPATEAVQPTPAPPPPQRATALLDATRAQRLSREKRLRERESREALAHSREGLAAPIPAPVDSPLESAPVSAPGWQQRPLVPASAPSRPQLPASTPAVERALAAEVREARSTLAIARETTRIQRDEITRLRAALAAADETRHTTGTFRSPLARAPERDRTEHAILRSRIVELEAELERASLELAELHRTMASHQQELVERSRRLSTLQERFDVQEQALDHTRRQAEQERRRHTEAQSLLERLRTTLRGVEPDSIAAASLLDDPRPGSLDHTPSTLPLATSGPASILSIAVAPPSTTAISVPIGSAPIMPRTDPSARARAPIFDLWLEEQVRRNFGPLGVDSTADLLREPLLRRARPHGAPLPILLIGRGVTLRARPLAEALVRIGSPSFVIHVADPDDATPLDGREDDSLREMLARCVYPERPDALRRLLDTLAPAALVSRDFLTWQPDLEAWLGELRKANAGGTCLVLLEQTGLGPVTPSPELTAIGERIWELLPERYTRNLVTGIPVASFREAFAGRSTPPRNDLLRRLREGFELELCAQFGFLSEAFVSGPIAACFDAKNPRDQRFLKQIADVDERRLESGSAAALHLIARIDPAAAS